MKKLIVCLLLVVFCTSAIAQSSSCTFKETNITSPGIWCGYVLQDYNAGQDMCQCRLLYDDQQCAKLTGLAVTTCETQAKSYYSYCLNKRIPYNETMYKCAYAYVDLYAPVTYPNPPSEDVYCFHNGNLDYGAACAPSTFSKVEESPFERGVDAKITLASLRLTLK